MSKSYKQKYGELLNYVKSTEHQNKLPHKSSEEYWGEHECPRCGLEFIEHWVCPQKDCKRLMCQDQIPSGTITKQEFDKIKCPKCKNNKLHV